MANTNKITDYFKFFLLWEKFIACILWISEGKKNKDVEPLGSMYDKLKWCCTPLKQ